MSGSRIAEIVQGQEDSTGAMIRTVYSKVANTYAVYGTDERVMVQFSDDEALGREQRRALVPLNPLRGEINGCIDSWRKPRIFFWDNVWRARRFDRRTADALTVALQGDQVHAEELLRAVKADILSDRYSLGRGQYVIAAFVAAVVFVSVLWILSKIGSTGFVEFVKVNHIMLAASVGCLGALFSIALGIRAREIRTDLEPRDNSLDALLRVWVGAVSAVILISLFRTELVGLTLGTTQIKLGAESSPASLHAEIVIAFLAGFAERLVGDVLSTAVLGAASPVNVDQGRKSAVQANEMADEQNPRGAKGAQRESGQPERTVHEHGVDDEVDNCLCDVQLDASELTDDVYLPEASGGIEKAA